jgi:hypothetical protein
MYPIPPSLLFFCNTSSSFYFPFLRLYILPYIKFLHISFQPLLLITTYATVLVKRVITSNGEFSWLSFNFFLHHRLDRMWTCKFEAILHNILYASSRSPVASSPWCCLCTEVSNVCGPSVTNVCISCHLLVYRILRWDLHFWKIYNIKSLLGFFSKTKIFNVSWNKLKVRTHSFIQYSVWRQVQSLLQNDSST